MTWILPRRLATHTHRDEPTVNHISLCAGYGGIDLGLGRAIRGLRTVALSEIEAFACANLVAKMDAGLMDAAPIWTDLRTYPFSRFHGLVDLLSGGFPCQPFSAAGKRAGDEDPRHLFPHILRGITECRPSLVFLENVEGIISAKLKGDGWRDPAGTPVLLHVLRELERVGYRATAGVFSSAEIGASHQRKRTFILAQLADALHDGHVAAEGPNGAGPNGAGPSAPQGWLRESEGMGSSPWDVRLCRPLPPGPDQHWWEPSRVIQPHTRVANRHGRYLAEVRSAAMADSQHGEPHQPESQDGARDGGPIAGRTEHRARGSGGEVVGSEGALADAASPRRTGQEDTSAGAGNAGTHGRGGEQPKRGSAFVADAQRAEWRSPASTGDQRDGRDAGREEAAGRTGARGPEAPDWPAYVGYPTQRDERGLERRGLETGAEADEGRQADYHLTDGSGEADGTHVAHNPSLRRRKGRAQHGGQQGGPDATVSGQPAVDDAASRGASTAQQSGRVCGAQQTGGESSRAAVADTQRPHEAGRLAAGGEAGSGRSHSQPGGSGPQAGEAESPVGRDTHGPAGWLDYAELCGTMDSRVDELRLLGNGVDPDVAEKAFRTLYRRLIQDNV